MLRSFGSVDTQASVFFVDPLFCTVTLVFFAQLFMVSLDPTFSALTFVFPLRSPHVPPYFVAIQPAPLAAIFFSLLLLVSA